MESIKDRSLMLQKEILPQIESSIMEYITRAMKFKKEKQEGFEHEVENLNEKLEKLKIGIECDDAAISFIRSKIQSNLQDKENLTCPKQVLHQKVERSRECASQLSTTVRLYEKRLGLSLKKLCNDTLWISFQYINDRESEHSAVVKVESGMYVLINCTPALTNIQDLIARLNGDNNFSKFIKELRMSFKDLYKNR